MNAMQQRLRDKRANDESGFTLIELLVVIVILGILAAVVVFSVRGITNRGTNSACEASRTAMLTAAEANYAQNTTNPTLEVLKDTGFISAGGGAIAGNIFTGKGWTLTLVPGTGTATATVTPVTCPTTP